MVDYFQVYFPKSDRYVKVEVSRPRIKENIEFDTLYLLDGQNAFKDSHAAFGRSIRATKVLNYVASKMKKRIIGVAIHNSGSDIGRINEYTPFNINKDINKDFKSEDLNICFNYCYDFIHTLIPLIESKYSVKKDINSRYIYGSSLSAITAIYMAFKYRNSFKYVGAFSTATFLFENEFYKFMNSHKNKNKDIFIYVGEKEKSDDLYVENTYLHSAKKLYDYFKENKNRVRLVIDSNGYHNEESWGNHMLEFINFINSDDIFYSPK